MDVCCHVHRVLGSSNCNVSYCFLDQIGVGCMTLPVKLEIGDKVKGSEEIDPSDRRFKGIEGKVVKIKGPLIFVKFITDLLPSRKMYRHELVKIPSKSD